MRSIYLFILWLLVALPALGQYTSFRARVGYGSYDMSDLKLLHQDLMSIYNVPIKATSAFPAYYNWQIQFMNHSRDGLNGLGFVWGHVSTGGRLAYSDYSGELRSDQLVRAENIGGMYERIIPVTENWSVVPAVQLLLTFTSMKSEELNRVYDYSSINSIQFDAIGGGITPEVGVRYRLGSLLVNAHIGYHLATSRELYRKGTGATYLFRSNGVRIKPQWDGLRGGITLGKTFGEINDTPFINLNEDNSRLIYKGGLVPGFYLGTHRFAKPKQILPLIQRYHDEQLILYYKEYRSNYILANIVATIGGAMIGWPMGSSFGGGEFNQPMFVAGISFVTIGMLIQEGASSKARKIAQRYNFLLR
ncbi:MAG: hypothetical protein RIG62_03035 [Cyclobacteriaceae bacterium]